MRLPVTARIWWILLLVVVALTVGNFWWKYHRAQTLSAEVRAMNGVIEFEYAGPDWLREWAEKNNAVPWIGWLWTDMRTLLFSNGAAVDDAWLLRLPDCPGLLWLDLRKTKVSGPGLRHFRNCERLGQVDLTDCGINDSNLEPLTSLKGLWNLRLAETDITDAGMKTLQRIPALQELDLSGTGVTDAALPQLAEFPHLQKVNVKGTNITPGGIVTKASTRLRITGP